MVNPDSSSYILTLEGYLRLKQELKELEEVQKKAAIERLKDAREMGALDDNPEYDAARDHLARVEGRILEIEGVLARAKVIDGKAGQKRDSVVRIGSELVVKIGDEQDTLRIVSSVEADPSNRKISNESPVGRALLGAKEGQEVEVDLQHSVLKYKIIKVL